MIALKKMVAIFMPSVFSQELCVVVYAGYVFSLVLAVLRIHGIHVSQLEYIILAIKYSIGVIQGRDAL